MKFSNQWTNLKTIKEVREYAPSHVDVEDFKAITSSRREKVLRTEDLDVPRLHNYTDYTSLKEYKARGHQLHAK